ncbi:acyl-CoA thioesterase [Pseudaquidulcibacter saccharophilus]|uniref:acyl-CoA thioesterase n=1 Tax=Pseudaquidulcibacter saccharophilus TaxID=2831900 RepID=UPI001EFF43B3|nr:acyl-CoA thioesterase [Pseudaquidulcibacter saccharophilus]
MPRPDPEILNPANYPYKVDVPTRFTDLNVAQHVSNTALVQMIEDARARFLIQYGAEFSGENVLMVVTNKVDYLAECFWPAPVEIYVKVSKVGNSSFELYQLAVQEGKAVGLSTLTMVNVVGGRASALTEKLKANLQELI